MLLPFDNHPMSARDTKNNEAPVLSYYPEGYNREGLLNAAAADSADLLPGQWATFREDLYKHEGEQGLEEFFREVRRRQERLEGRYSHTCYFNQ
jgi:hypothetical protein